MKNVRIPPLYFETRFRRAYGADVWRSPDEYRTRDGVIPFGLFWLYWRELDANEAADRISLVRALDIANYRLNRGKDDDPVPETLRHDLRLAHREPPEA